MKRLRHSIAPVLLILLVLVSTSGCSKRARAKRALRAGNRDFAAEKYDDAEIEFKKTLRLDRLNPIAIGQLGRIYVLDGRLIDARIYLAKAVELMSNNIPFQLAYGQLAAAMHDFTNSAIIAQRVLSWQPTNDEALILLVNSYVHAGRTQQWLATLPHIKENPAYHTAQAVLDLRQSEMDQAENELKQAVAAEPKSSQAYYAMAELRARQKDEKGMLECLKKASDLAPLRSNLRMKYFEFLIQSNRGEEARKSLQEITKKAPDYLPAWVGLMNLSMTEKKYDEAAQDAETVVGRDERNYDGLLGRGAARLAMGQVDNAVQQFEHMNAVFPRSPQARYELATAYLAAHSSAKCIENLRVALEIAPNYPQANLLLAQVYIDGGDPGDAAELLMAYSKRVSTVPAEAHLLLAEADVMLGKPETALAIYRSVAKALPKNPKIPYLMGVVFAGQHNNAEARAAFEKALDLSPDFSHAAEQLVDVDIADHRFQDAAAVAQTQIQRSPTAAEPRELQAKVDYAQQNFPRAETNLLKAIELDPKSPTPHVQLADVYATVNKNQEALRQLNEAIARTNDPAIYMQLGEIDNRLADYPASCQAYEKVLSINANSIAALNNLSYLYAEHLHKLDRAYELAEKAHGLMPDNPNIGDTLGWILFRQGDYQRALAVLQDCADRAPGDPEIQYHVGMASYMLDQQSQARQALQRAVASPTDFPGKDDARKRLAVLDINPASAGPSVLAQLEKALAEYPDDPVVLDRIGIQQEKAGEWEKAAATYQTSLKQRPDSVPAMAKLAWIYTYRLNDPDKAMPLAKEAHRLALDNAEVSGTFGRLLLHTHDYDRAMSVLDEAAQEYPNRTEILHDLAWAYYSAGRVNDAETMMQRAVQNHPQPADGDDAKRFLALVDAFSSPAKAAAAASQARRVLQADPQFVPALMVAGLADEGAGNFKDAQDNYNKALAVFPKFSPAQRQLAILDARHFPEDASGFAIAEQARAAYPDDPDVAKSLGILSFYQAKYPRSVELLQESAANRRDDGELYYYLGKDYFQLKRSKESKQTLERALALKIPDNLAADARKTLASLK